MNGLFLYFLLTYIARFSSGHEQAPEIAAMHGVTINTLQVLCSRRGVSLRKGGHLLRRKILALPEAQLTLSETALETLRQAARAMGVDEA